MQTPGWISSTWCLLIRLGPVIPHVYNGCRRPSPPMVDWRRHLCFSRNDPPLVDHSGCNISRKYIYGGFRGPGLVRKVRCSTSFRVSSALLPPRIFRAFFFQTGLVMAKAYAFGCVARIMVAPSSDRTHEWAWRRRQLIVDRVKYRRAQLAGPQASMGVIM
jgi:hypothetical protein